MNLVPPPGAGTGPNVIDGLSSTSTTDALSANQGRVLNNLKEDKTNKVSSFQATPDDTHYPSEKLVSDKLAEKQSQIESNDSDIALLTETINNLASASGEISSSTAQDILTAETKLSFEIVTQSTDTGAFEFNDTNDEITFKKAGNYNFVSSLVLTSSISGAVDINFNLRDVSDETLVKNQGANVEIPPGDSETISMNTLLVFGDGDIPKTIKINHIADVTGIEITSYQSILTSSNTAQGVKSHTELTERDAPDSHPQSAITNLVADLGNRYTKTESDTNFEPKDATILKDSDIDVTVQGYDPDTTKNDVPNIFTTAQKTSITASSNDIDFALNNNFVITATASNITASNLTGGQGGVIIINDAENITGWGAEFKFKTLPTLSGKETFAYFIEDATNIMIGVVK